MATPKINPDIKVDSLAPMGDSTSQQEKNVKLNIQNIHDTLVEIQTVLNKIVKALEGV